MMSLRLSAGRVQCRPVCSLAPSAASSMPVPVPRLPAADVVKMVDVDELAPFLTGLKKATRRMRVTATDLLESAADFALDARGRSRCEHLNLRMRWVAEPVGAQAGGSVTGLARVTLGSLDNDTESVHMTDRVNVDVDVASMSMSNTQELLSTGESSPESKRLISDVVMAVQSLDSVVMEKLNDFLWDVEKRANLRTVAEASV